VVIDTSDKLAAFLGQLEAAEWISLDTEADSLHAYPEKLCLVQISIEGRDELVDPLAGLNLDPLWKICHDHQLILHGADYDLRLLRKNQQFIPTRIFDTMLAARLLGVEKFGLGDLVQNFLGITLEKGSQKADWARRPLTEKMESYARNDTRYLKPLAEKLCEALAAKGRVTWHEEACQRLIEECSRIPEADPDAWRIKGSNQLGRAGLSVLRELHAWREQEALSANKPPYFILSHETMIAVAAGAGSHRNWRNIIPHSYPSGRRRELEAAVHRGLAVPLEEQPTHRKVQFRRQTEAEKHRYEDLRRKRDHAARTLHLDPSLIASRTMLGLLSESWEENSRLLMNWQRELLKPKKTGV
jgi:ribonuclease D